jgi:hypothetical protein
MRRFRSLSAAILALPAFAVVFVACSGAVLPVAENDAADSGGSTSPNGSSAPDGTLVTPFDASFDASIDASASGGDGGPSGCTPACNSGEICVSEQVVGGPIFLPDAGACPPGLHLQDQRCEMDPTYHCVTTPAACAGAAKVDCKCAASACSPSAPYHQCRSATSSLVTCIWGVP